LVEGPTDGKSVVVAGQAIAGGRGELFLRADASCVMENGAAAGAPDAHVLVLQGRPIGEPVVSRGPFVMNSQKQIAEAYADYQATQFGGWPWEEDAVVFPRSQGRFADVVGADGKLVRSTPPAEAKVELR
jgi:hypothetical protein